MTHNDENDIDLDTHEDFDKEPAARSSFKEAWDGNPMLKIGAVVVGLAVAVGVYMVFFNTPEDTGLESKISRGGAGVKTVVGKTQNDPEYAKRIASENEKRVKMAETHGTSAIPTPLNTATSDQLALPAPAATPPDDPLREWRQRAEEQRLKADREQVPDQPPAPTIQAPVRPITPVAQAKVDPNMAAALAAQMRVIIGAQAPVNSSHIQITQVNSAYVEHKKEEESKARSQGKQSQSRGSSGGNVIAGYGQGGSNGGGGDGGDAAAKPKLIVAAGNIAYAQLLTELNSDIQSPAMAMILSGPFEGGKALGQFTKQDEYLTLTFSRIVKDGVTYGINGIALDENTTLPAEQSDVNHHYFQRIVLPAAAAFLTAYTSARAQTGTQTTTTSGGGVASDTPPPTTKQAVNQGISSASGTVASMLTQQAGRPITVYVHKGTTMGILFLETVTTASATQ